MTLNLLPITVAAILGTVSGGGIHLPDPRTGVINGHVATLVWPARNDTKELLPVDGCTGHLVPLDDLNAEKIQPCGEWFQPPTGRYKVWVEGPNYISPSPTILISQDDFPGDHGLPAVFPVVPAGWIAASRESNIPPEHGLRLLSLGTTSLQRAFDRRVAKARDSTLMPAGRALAGVFHRQTGEAIAISQPVDVIAGKTTIVAPQAPKVDSDVFVVVDRPRLVVPEQLDPVQLVLEGDRGVRPPDVMLDSPERVYGVWYGVVGRRATLRVESKTLTFPATSIALRPKQVVTLRSKMTLLPRLAVKVIAPPDAFKKLAVEVNKRAGDPTALLHADARPNETTALAALPADRLRVTLTADDWRFTKDVDLRDGRDGEVSFTLEPVIVRGTVYWGRDAAPAEVGFQIAEEKWVTAKTREDGTYEATLWETGQYTTRVVLAKSSAPPLFRAFTEVERDRPLDFHVPKTRIVAHVRDADTGRPITGAKVSYTSRFSENDGPGQSMVQRFVTDDAGTAVLPPLRKGEATIMAGAAGYLTSEPQTLPIDVDTERDLDFALRRAEVTARIRVLLAGDEPAGGAEAWAVSAAAPERLLWRGVVAPDGMLEVAAPTAGAVLVVRHQQAATFAQALSDAGDTIRLSAPAPPLTITATSSSGDPLRAAALTVWIDGIRLSGPVAAFATWMSAAGVTPDGMATLRNLPAAPLRLLATRRAPIASVAAGAYDTLAATISWPWPASVKVPAAD